MPNGSFERRLRRLEESAGLDDPLPPPYSESECREILVTMQARGTAGPDDILRPLPASFRDSRGQVISCIHRKIIEPVA